MRPDAPRPQVAVSSSPAAGSRSGMYPPELVAWTDEYLSSPDNDSPYDLAGVGRTRTNRTRSAVVAQPTRLLPQTNINRSNSFGVQHRYTRSDTGPAAPTFGDTLQDPRMASRASFQSESSYNAIEDDRVSLNQRFLSSSISRCLCRAMRAVSAICLESYLL